MIDLSVVGRLQLETMYTDVLAERDKLESDLKSAIDQLVLEVETLETVEIKLDELQVLLADKQTEVGAVARDITS